MGIVVDVEASQLVTVTVQIRREGVRHLGNQDREEHDEERGPPIASVRKALPLHDA